MLEIKDVIDIVMWLKDTCAVKITINHYGVCHLWSRKKWDCIWTYHGFWGGDSDAAEEQSEAAQEETQSQESRDNL